MKVLLIIAAISGFTAVLIGAIGSHALAPYMSEKGPEFFNRASLYHHILSLALLGCAVLWPTVQKNTHSPAKALKFLKLSAGLFISGILLFCGLLYLLAIFPNHSLSFLIPLGGLFAMSGWLMLIVLALSLRTDKP